MNPRVRVALVLASVLAGAACGGSTSGAGGGGAGGTPGGGGTEGGGTGGITTGGSGGTGGCGGGGAADCFDYCTGHLTLPVCASGQWTCKNEPCDAGNDAATCPANQVPTVGGCLSCNDATLAYSNAIDAARVANAACNTEADCVLTPSGTTCAGACQVAVSKSGESAFAAALAQIDTDYCSGFVAVCGYSTPKCALPTLACTAGKCETVFN